MSSDIRVMPTINDLLHSATKTLTQHELQRFRDELARRLPQTIEDAARAALQPKTQTKRKENDS